MCPLLLWDLHSVTIWWFYDAQWNPGRLTLYCIAGNHTVVCCCDLTVWPLRPIFSFWSFQKKSRWVNWTNFVATPKSRDNRENWQRLSSVAKYHRPHTNNTQRNNSCFARFVYFVYILDAQVLFHCSSSCLWDIHTDSYQVNSTIGASNGPLFSFLVCEI